MIYQTFSPKPFRQDHGNEHRLSAVEYAEL